MKHKSILVTLKYNRTAKASNTLLWHLSQYYRYAV